MGKMGGQYPPVKMSIFVVFLDLRFQFFKSIDQYCGLIPFFGGKTGAKVGNYARR